MDCTNKGSIIVTIALQIHGRIIELNLSPEKTAIFDNVRLFSKAGEFEDAYTSKLGEIHILYKLNEMFQKDLQGPSIELIEQYVEYSKPKYSKFLKDYKVTTADKINEKREKVCRLFHNVTIDKILSTGFASDNILTRLCDSIMPEYQGIFLVSVHEKIADDQYKLIFPDNNSSKNLNLLNVNNLQKFAYIFENVAPDVEKLASHLPYDEYLVRENAIESNPKFTEQEKEIMQEQQKKEFYGLLMSWSGIEMKNINTIETIKLSTLVSIIKKIVGNKCKLNLFDYSCNSFTRYLPKEQIPYGKHFETYDIENPPDRTWGGKKRRKMVTKRRNKRNKKNRRKNNSRKNHK